MKYVKNIVLGIIKKDMNETLTHKHELNNKEPVNIRVTRNNILLVLGLSVALLLSTQAENIINHIRNSFTKDFDKSLLADIDIKNENVEISLPDNTESISLIDKGGSFDIPIPAGTKIYNIKMSQLPNNGNGFVTIVINFRNSDGSLNMQGGEINVNTGELAMGNGIGTSKDTGYDGSDDNKEPTKTPAKDYNTNVAIVSKQGVTGEPGKIA